MSGPRSGRSSNDDDHPVSASQNLNGPSGSMPRTFFDDRAQNGPSDDEKAEPVSGNGKGKEPALPEPAAVTPVDPLDQLQK